MIEDQPDFAYAGIIRDARDRARQLSQEQSGSLAKQRARAAMLVVGKWWIHRGTLHRRVQIVGREGSTIVYRCKGTKRDPTTIRKLSSIRFLEVFTPVDRSWEKS